MKPDVAETVASLVADGYDEYKRHFDEITRRAARRFATRDWAGVQADAGARLRLYDQVVHRTVPRVSGFLGERPDADDGARVKAAFTRCCAGRPDIDLAETFFNSVMRRTFRVVGVNRAVEYVGDEIDAPPTAQDGIFRRHEADGELDAVFLRVLKALPLEARWESIERDAARIADAVRGEPATRERRIEAVEVLDAVFYRNKGAYLVGRLVAGDAATPLVLALLNGEQGIRVDAALLTSDEASVVFGFTRSYFEVETDRPRALVEFLRSLMPLKRVDELYTAIGFNRHGKTELYRALMRHLEESGDRFELAPGARGMVMSVFTLPRFNVVFKIIKDRFDYPKKSTREQVRERYRFIFARDRVGRLADAQEFERLEFRTEWFAEEVLDEFRRHAAKTIRIGDDGVVIEHLYTERRVTPLNLFLLDAPDDEALDAILDYGCAIKDMAAANIFPGDMLLKNFGVTRHGRVIFYDYDEVDLLTNVHFREMPEPADEHELMSDTPWFHVGEHDVFPEEFSRFIGVPDRFRDRFEEEHGQIFTVEYWRGLQERLREGEMVDFYPYRAARRLGRS